MATRTSKAPDFSSFVIPPCRRCGGMLKPDVVFFGENVPRDRVDAAFRHLDKADAMLIVGSSLMVYSGFRFVERAVSLGKAGGRDQPWPNASGRAPYAQSGGAVRSPRSLSCWAREPRQARSSPLA